jgi:menaquinone-dependent protoporphyrinogen oxidase
MPSRSEGSRQSRVPSNRPLLVLYATREGQTRKIAEYVARVMRSRGDVVDVVDAAALPAGFDLGAYAGVVLAASVHVGKHEREAVDFVKTHREALDRLPTAFLSVSLSEATVENATAPSEKRAQASADVKRLVDAFCADTGLHPERVWPVAGALVFSAYGPLKRFVMRLIARRAGEKDLEHDHEYTDWRGLDRFVASLAEEMEHAA